MQATARTVVDAPIETVWDSVSTVENMEAWVEGISEVRRDGTGDLDEGSRFSSKYTYRGETFDVEYEVTACEPPSRLDIRWTEGPFPFAGSLRLVEVDGGTEVSNTLDAGSDGLATSVIFTVFGPLVRRFMRRQLASDLEDLDGFVQDAGERDRESVAANSG